MKKVFIEKVSYFFNPPPPEPKKRHGLRLKPIGVIFEKKLVYVRLFSHV